MIAGWYKMYIRHFGKEVKRSGGGGKGMNYTPKGNARDKRTRGCCNMIG